MPPLPSICNEMHEKRQKQRLLHFCFKSPPDGSGATPDATLHRTVPFDDPPDQPTGITVYHMFRIGSFIIAII